MFSDSFENVELSSYKWATHLDKLTTLAKGGDTFPVTIELDLVSYCNHNCGWCVDPLHRQNALERSFVSELLNELKLLDIEGIVFKGGGEPTRYKLFPSVIEETRKLGFEVGIVTNGSRLVNLYDRVIQNASYLRVSIDGPTPESHQKIHRSKDFEKIIEGIHKVVELRNHLQQRHPIIGVSFAMDYSLIDLIDKAIYCGDSLGVDYILLRPPFFEEVGRKNTMTI
jgi:wyosine [tRNA(Phe)-imidazoG37] synthetase (radical SAM superfamily)